MIDQYTKADFYFRYPFLLPSRYKNPEDIQPDDMLVNVFCELPEGWVKGFLLDMCEELRTELLNVGALYDYKVLKVSYKDASFSWEALGTPRDSEVRNIIKEYQKQAPYYCTVCGQKAERVQKSLSPRPLCTYCWQSEYGLDSERIWKDPGDKEFTKTIFELKQRPFYYVDEWIRLRNEDLYDKFCKLSILEPIKEYLVNIKQPVEYVFWTVISLLCGALLAYALMNIIHIASNFSLFLSWLFILCLHFFYCKRYIFFSDDEIYPEFIKYLLCRAGLFALEFVYMIIFTSGRGDLFGFSYTKLFIEYLILFFTNKYFVFR